MTRMSDKTLNSSDVETVSMSKVEELKKLVPENVKQSRLAFDGLFKKKKILCCVWLVGENGNRDKFVGSTKRKIGKTDFVIKGKRYFLNYDFLREGKKYYEYHADIRYSNAPLSNQKLLENDARLVIATQADSMLVDGVVRVLMGKGGIPAMYLLVAFIVVAVAMAGTMYLFSQYQTMSVQLEKQKTTNTSIITENTELKTRLAQYGEIIP